MADKSKSCKTNGTCNKEACSKNCADTTTTTFEAVTAQDAAESSTTKDSAEVMRESASRFYDLFDRYNKLRVLAQPLDGLPQISPYPENIKIDKVDLTFTVNGQTHTAVITGSRIVGELASLIANELSLLIEQMYTEIYSLAHVSSGMQKAIEVAIASRAEPPIADNAVTDTPQ